MKRMFDRVIMTKADMALIAVILAAAAAVFLFLFLFSEEGSSVVISRGGEEIGRYSLQEDSRIPLSDEEGENLLIIEDGTAWMEEADCPDGLCVRQGKISGSGESIICLPHELVVTIEGHQEQEENAVDVFVS